MKAVALFLLCSGLAAAAPPASLYYDHTIPAVTFAAAEIHKAYASRGETLVERDLQGIPANGDAVRIVILADRNPYTGISGLVGVAPKSDKPQSYAIRKRGAMVVVLGVDAAGAMYGGLDVAEAVRLGSMADLTDSDHSPHIERRGIKFNIPLDVRTPSYSDNSDSAQKNIGEMWSFDFWREFLDEMARRRFNVLTLWNLHPFPSIVKVPEYPDVALDDVQRTDRKSVV